MQAWGPRLNIQRIFTDFSSEIPNQQTARLMLQVITYQLVRVEMDQQIAGVDDWTGSESYLVYNAAGCTNVT
jgi:hypothetical protein